ncbi:MAG: hypothetical protein LBP64_00755 [Tannerella sp.]|jgi:hypothetical protein|nr:hypothetical protein [Tannerella sp.]
MYTPGTVIYFTPFCFPGGNSKNKYFLVLSTVEDNLMLASLPTSKDHIPRSIEKRHGCINDEATRVNCYLFEAGKIISECGMFGFKRNTYIYGEQIAFVDRQKMRSVYREEGTDYHIVCNLSDTEFQAVKDCLKSSGVVKNKFKSYL